MRVTTREVASRQRGRTCSVQEFELQTSTVVDWLGVSVVMVTEVVAAGALTTTGVVAVAVEIDWLGNGWACGWFLKTGNKTLFSLDLIVGPSG